MAYNPRKLGFVLAATDHGTMIVNRFDYRMIDQTRGYGVGFNLLENAAYDAGELTLVQHLLSCRRQYFGDGVMALDCGANIGVFTVEWAKAMTGWGSVIAFEAQERLFYALAGNITINNCFNARAVHVALAAEPGVLRIPQPDYLSPGTFGSLELRQTANTEFIGQTIDYSDSSLVPVRSVSIDSLELSRVDLLKVDVEGMELAVLAGARETIERHQPIIIAERIKLREEELASVLEAHGYQCYPMGGNLLAIHPSDKTGNHVKINP